MMFGAPLKNVGLFAAVLIGATVVVMVILFWLATQFGFDGGSAAWIGPFAAACITAGQSYAKKSDWNWTADDRHALALAYAVTATVIGLVLSVAYYSVLDPNTFAILGTFWGIFILVFGSALGGVISYAIARFLLARVVRPKAPKPAMTSSLSEAEK